MDITANLQRGEALFLDGLLDEAEIVFQEILCLKPDHYEALNNLGVISHSRGAVEEAEQFFLNAVDVSGEYLEALSNLADLYESRREWGKALVQIRRLLDLKPEDDGLKERLARLRVETSSMEIQPHLDVRRTKIEDKAGDPDSSPSTFLDQGSLKAAFLEVNITPEVSPSKPVYLQGMAGGLRKATSISSPLMMQLLLIEDANFTKLLLVSADLFGFGSEIVSLVRSMAEPWGIQPEGILLNASHTHYAPGTVSTTSSELGPFHEQYSKTIGNAIGQSLDALYERLEACEIGLGHTDLQIGLNRRLPGRDGILFAPNKRGYYDSLTPFFRVELRQTGKKLVVLNHGCHPTGLGNLPLISSDFVGYMRESLKQKGVADGVMFFQGAAGSSKEAAYSENKRSSFSQSLEDARRNGVYMAEKIALALQSQLLPVKGDIFCTMNTASLPINHLPAKEIVEQVSKKHDSPPVMREWVEKLNKAFPEGRYPSSIPMDLQMVCIGKALRLLSFPAEPVSEVAVKLREAAPEGAKTFILGYTNGLLGYLPTDTMIKDGGYEPRESSFYYLLPSPFALGTESAVMKAFASCMEKQQEEGKPNGYGRYHLNRNPRRAFFVLSSGRCGTLTLAKLLSTATNAKVWHHPRPYLVRETLEAYWGKADKIATFWKARASIIQKTWADGLIHGETDHNLTAFSDVIAQEIPDAKFIILVRDPRDFVRSGMRRGYYTGHPWDIGRLRPCEDAPDFEQWKTMEPFDKVCWLWSETYQRIQVLAEKIGRDRVMMLCFEELISKPETVYPLFNFLGLEGFDRQIIAEKQKNRYNQQTSGTFPKVEEWSTQLHSIISNYCGVPALRYGYDLRRSVPANAKNDAIRAPDDGSKVECSEKKAPFVNLHRYGIYVHPASVIKCRHVQIGKGTRINGPITIKGVGSCVIGKYCALGDDIHIITSNHLMGYANLQDGLQSRMGFRNILSHKGIIEIGCNVWIGDNVLLLPGVKVGHGEVIGAGSVVTRGVPDFTVVAGVPASEIRKRFSEEIIAQMLDIAWWDWPEERMLKNHVFFETDFGLKPDLDISAILVE